MTTRHPGFRDRSGHDQFFSAFDRFGATRPERIADMMAGVLNGLARQNTFYLEAMVTPQGFATRVRGSQAGWKGGDLKAQKAALEALEDCGGAKRRAVFRQTRRPFVQVIADTERKFVRATRPVRGRRGRHRLQAKGYRHRSVRENCRHHL